jgi:hypothetical protein
VLIVSLVIARESTLVFHIPHPFLLKIDIYSRQIAASFGVAIIDERCSPSNPKKGRDKYDETCHASHGRAGSSMFSLIENNQREVEPAVQSGIRQRLRMTQSIARKHQPNHDFHVGVCPTERTDIEITDCTTYALVSDTA